MLTITMQYYDSSVISLSKKMVELGGKTGKIEIVFKNNNDHAEFGHTYLTPYETLHMD